MLSNFAQTPPATQSPPVIFAGSGGDRRGVFLSLRPTRLFALAQQISNPQGFWVNACIGEPLPYRSFRGQA